MRVSLLYPVISPQRDILHRVIVNCEFYERVAPNASIGYTCHYQVIGSDCFVMLWKASVEHLHLIKELLAYLVRAVELVSSWSVTKETPLPGILREMVCC